MYNKYILTLLIITLLLSCRDEPVKPVDAQEGIDSILLITNLSAVIISPIQKRDFSYYDNGYEGIFENPDSLKQFEGKIQLTYGTNSIRLDSSAVSVTWRSNLDGVLYDGHPRSYLRSDIIEGLSKGVHTIYFEVKIDKLNAIDSIKISNAIALETTNSGKSVNLKWSKYEGNGFLSYDIYRESSDPIAQIDDINTLVYEDLEMESLVDKYQYQIIVNTLESYDHLLGSQLDSMHSGIFLEFPYYVFKTIKDPVRKKTYSIVRPQSSLVDSDKYGVLIIVLSSDSLKIDSHILTEDRFADLDVSPDGKYLFLCQERVEKITRLDLDTYETFTIDTETNGWGIHKIEVDNNYVLYCHRAPPTSGGTSFWIYNGLNGNYIDGPTSGLRHGDIELNNTNNTLYGSESNTSDGRMYKYDADGFSIIQGLSYPVWPSYVSYPDPFLLLSDNDQYIFWDKFQLDTELNVVRTFDTKIKACSPNNLFLSDFSKSYKFDDMTVVCKFPESPPTENTSIVFIDDETMLFHRAYNTNINGEEYTYLFRINIK